MNPLFARSAFFAGLTALIPVPFFDEYVERRVTRDLFARIAEHRGTPLDDATLRTLTEDRSSLAMGCLTLVIVWPLKKLFRTIVYVLTVKDVFDGVTRTAHRATLFEHALDRGLLPEHAEDVRVAMDDLLGKLRYSPVSRVAWRQERPDVTWSAGDGMGRAVHWLQRHGGGGLLVSMFEERLGRGGR